MPANQPHSATYAWHEKMLLVRPEYLNHVGTLFGGYLLMWADEMAFNAASLTFPAANFVTRRFEAFDFTAPAAKGDILSVRSRVLRTSNTSCVVEVVGEKSRTHEVIFQTTAIMVNVDGKARKAPLPKPS